MYIYIYTEVANCLCTHEHRPRGFTACTVRQHDMLDRKDKKTTNGIDCPTASFVRHTSCRRGDREPVPVAVWSSRPSEAMSSTQSCAVGELHNMVNHFVNYHFRKVKLSVLYLLWKRSFNGAPWVRNNMKCVKINQWFVVPLAEPVILLTETAQPCVYQ